MGVLYWKLFLWSKETSPKLAVIIFFSAQTWWQINKVVKSCYWYSRASLLDLVIIVHAEIFAGWPWYGTPYLRMVRLHVVGVYWVPRFKRSVAGHIRFAARLCCRNAEVRIQTSKSVCTDLAIMFACPILLPAFWLHHVRSISMLLKLPFCWQPSTLDQMIINATFFTFLLFTKRCLSDWRSEANICENMNTQLLLLLLWLLQKTRGLQNQTLLPAGSRKFNNSYQIWIWCHAWSRCTFRKSRLGPYLADKLNLLLAILQCLLNNILTKIDWALHS